MKKFEHIVKVCILIFSMLSINLPAWGATLYGKVAVAEGKGTATVEIINGYGISCGSVSSTSAKV